MLAVSQLGQRRMGTCSSMPVLYVTLGRRLGYPVKLVTAKAHLFVRWEQTGERFNLSKNMTSDGISTEDWEVVQDYAAKIANAACADDEAASDVFTEKLSRYLECLEVKYGKRASILATRADYTTDLSQRLHLLQEAYELARQSNDKKNLTLTASSLAQLFAEEVADVSSADKWLAALADALGEKWDDLEYQEFQKLSAQVERLKQRRTRGPIA
jgi:hypothetical protein